MSIEDNQGKGGNHESGAIPAFLTMGVQPKSLNVDV